MLEHSAQLSCNGSCSSTEAIESAYSALHGVSLPGAVILLSVGNLATAMRQCVCRHDATLLSPWCDPVSAKRRCGLWPHADFLAEWTLITTVYSWSSFLIDSLIDCFLPGMSSSFAYWLEPGFGDLHSKLWRHSGNGDISKKCWIQTLSAREVLDKLCKNKEEIGSEKIADLIVSLTLDA